MKRSEQYAPVRSARPHSSYLCVACLAAAAAAVCLLRVGAARAVEPPGVRIAVLDLEKVFSGWEKYKEALSVLKERREKYDSHLTSLSKEVEKLQRKADALDPQSEEFVKIQAELLKKEALLKATSEQYDLELRRADALYTETLRGEIKEVVAAYARQEGIGVVLQRAMVLPEGVWESVLYAEASLDITEETLRRLNEKK